MQIRRHVSLVHLLAVVFSKNGACLTVGFLLKKLYDQLPPLNILFFFFA
jgi:hypothetical protein